MQKSYWRQASAAPLFHNELLTIMDIDAAWQLAAVHSPAVDGVRAFGAIMDRKAGWRATPFFPKMFEQEDPSAVYLMTQSAPLMIATRPNATLKAKVL